MADTVRRALAALPARQRAALVLRYFEDLPEAQGGTKPGGSGTSVYQGVYDPARRAVRMVVVTPDTGHVTTHLDGQVYVQIPADSTDTAHGVAGTLHWVLTFWDFGIRERVTLPPDSQVYRDPAPDPRELAERLKDRRR